ncbi:MAG: NAD(+) synthase [Tannerella sp.]|jgi:NAD+ synthase|nr:NAD(+) synthase [Tannerella sp.]
MLEKKSFVITEKNVAFYAGEIGNWIRKQVQEADRKGVVFGMSGGVDCSVVARLCQLGDVDLHLVVMPYGNDMELSRSYADAMTFIDQFALPYHIFDIRPAVDALITDRFASDETTMVLSHANLRPRIRMTYLYQLAQMSDRFVCGTSNLAERVAGYFTKWGDGACDISPIALLTKQEVYILARHLEIPDSIIRKPPSAGLWEGQTDENELGMTYNQIDAFILDGTSGSKEVDAMIRKRMAWSMHKFVPIPVFQV